VSRPAEQSPARWHGAQRRECGETRLHHPSKACVEQGQPAMEVSCRHDQPERRPRDPGDRRPPPKGTLAQILRRGGTQLPVSDPRSWIASRALHPGRLRLRWCALLTQLARIPRTSRAIYKLCAVNRLSLALVDCQPQSTGDGTGRRPPVAAIIIKWMPCTSRSPQIKVLALTRPARSPWAQLQKRCLSFIRRMPTPARFIPLASQPGRSLRPIQCRERCHKPGG